MIIILFDFIKKMLDKNLHINIHVYKILKQPIKIYFQTISFGRMLRYVLRRHKTSPGGAGQLWKKANLVITSAREHTPSAGGNFTAQ